MYENLIDEVDFRGNETVQEWTMAQFKGKDKAIDLSLEKEGALILTNQRVIFKGGVVLGHGFQDEISVPFKKIKKVSSERKLFKDEYRKLLVLKWQSNGEKNSAVFYPTDSKNQTDGVMKSISSLKPGEKGPAEIWKEKIESSISSHPNNQRSPPKPNDSKDIPPPPQKDQKTTQKGEMETKQQTSTIKCPNCGKETQQDMNFCPYCGTEIERTCSNCGMEVKEDWHFCPNCRNEI